MKVNLFKSVSETNEDNFLQVLNNSGFFKEVNIIPVLSFQFTNINILWKKIQSPNNFQGLIITSLRAIEAIQLSIQSEELWINLKTEWLSKKIFCVGPSTTQEAIEFFGPNPENISNIIQSELGNAESLGKVILEGNENQIHPYLYPAGNLKTKVLDNILIQGNVQFEELTMYKTFENPKIKECCDHLIENFKENDKIFLVFFSPSGAKFSWEHVKNLKNKTIVAIGPTTKKYLDQINSEEVFECKNPTPQSLLDILIQILQINQNKV